MKNWKKNIKKNTAVYVLLVITAVSLFFNVRLATKFAKIGSVDEVVLVERVVDGDTLVVAGGKYVRLYGLDAPEYPQGCMGDAAKERLEEVVLGKEVRVEEFGEDNFGRILGYVFWEDVFINMTMVEEGLAKQDGDKGDLASVILDAEAEAKKLGKGIWRYCVSDQGCEIKGNVRRDKGTSIYHLPNCYNWEKVVVDESKGDRWFCSEEEAVAAGFIKSEDCP